MSNHHSRRISATRACDVAIVGGGAIGLGIAFSSASQGLDVVVVDAKPGRGASWAAAGMLAPVTEAHPGEEDLLHLNLASAELYAGWVAELERVVGIDVGYRATGTLLVARDGDDNAALSEVFALQKSLGLQVERLRSRGCRSREPALAPSVRGGILVRGDHEIDNRALVTALLEACRRVGVTYERQRAVEIAGDRRVSGVVLEDGRLLKAGAVVVAAGSWSNQLGGLARDALPEIRPVKGQLLHLRGRPHSGMPTHVVRGLDFYAVPRGDGRLVLGATVEEQGFDEAITAGAVYTLLRDATDVLPDVVEMELTEVACGLRPATRDNKPALGETIVPGLVAAVGHFRNGILLTPITADLITRLLVSGRTPAALEPFSPRRFRVAAGAAP